MNRPQKSTAVLGLGTALPQYAMSQDEAVTLAHETYAREADEQRLVKALYRKSGVKQRFTAIPHRLALEWMSAPAAVASTLDGVVAETDFSEAEALARRGLLTGERMQHYRDLAPELALRSSAAAMVDGKVTPESITHLVTVSCTGFFSPGVDVMLIDGLQLPRSTERIHVGFMGCHGAVNGLRAATALVDADPTRRVLLCAVELCSLHYCFEWEPLRAVGNAIFADGSAAVVIGANDSTDASVLRPAVCGSYLIPDSTDAMAWTIGNHGFEMILSPRVPDLIGEHVKPWMVEWLGKQGLTIEQVGGWAVHPGGPRVLSAVEEALGLDRAHTAVSREVLASCGNMSSPTILFILDRLRKMNMPRPYVTLGFGPGLAAEAALFV